MDQTSEPTILEGAVADASATEPVVDPAADATTSDSGTTAVADQAADDNGDAGDNAEETEGEDVDKQTDPVLAEIEAELAFTEDTDGGEAGAGKVDASSTEAPGATSPPPSVATIVSVSDIEQRFTDLKAKVEARWANDDYDNTVEAALLGFIETAILPAVQSGVRAEESFRTARAEQAGRSVAEAAVSATEVIASTFGVRANPRALIQLAADGAYEAICKIDGKPMGIPTAADFKRIFEVKYGAKLASRPTPEPKPTPPRKSKAPSASATGGPKTAAEQILADYLEGQSLQGK